MDTLASLLASGHRVRCWAADRGDPPDDVRAAQVAVVTCAPQDDSWVRLAGVLAAADAVIAVTWHPPDERPAVPGVRTWVQAGAITAELLSAVDVAHDCPSSGQDR